MQAFEYVAAESLGEAISLLDKHGNQARILSGGTDLIVQVRENRRQVDLLVDIKKIPEFNEISYNGSLQIGASVPCYQVYGNEDVQRLFPALVDSFYRILSKVSEKELLELDKSYWPNCLKAGLKAKGLNL